MLLEVRLRGELTGSRVLRYRAAGLGRWRRFAPAGRDRPAVVPPLTGRGRPVTRLTAGTLAQGGGPVKRGYDNYGLGSFEASDPATWRSSVAPMDASSSAAWTPVDRRSAEPLAPGAASPAGDW